MLEMLALKIEDTAQVRNYTPCVNANFADRVLVTTGDWFKPWRIRLFRRFCILVILISGLLQSLNHLN